MQGWVALVLAAGQSRRFGSDKMLADLGGRPVIGRTVDGVVAQGFDAVVVVVADRAIEVALAGVERLSVARLERSASLSQSLSAGLAASPAADRGLFVFLADMPLVPFELCAALGDLALSSGFAARLVHDGKPGHPVCFVSAAIGSLATLSGDRGAAPLLKGRPDVCHLETMDVGATLDIDTRADLALAERLWNSRLTSAKIDKAMSPGAFPRP